MSDRLNAQRLEEIRAREFPPRETQAVIEELLAEVERLSAELEAARETASRYERYDVWQGLAAENLRLERELEAAKRERDVARKERDEVEGDLAGVYGSLVAHDVELVKDQLAEAERERSRLREALRVVQRMVYADAWTPEIVARVAREALNAGATEPKQDVMFKGPTTFTEACDCGSELPGWHRGDCGVFAGAQPDFDYEAVRRDREDGGYEDVPQRQEGE